MAEWLISFVASQVANKVATKYYNEYFNDEKSNEDIIKQIEYLNKELKEARRQLDKTVGIKENIMVFPLSSEKQNLLIEAINTKIIPEFFIFNEKSISDLDIFN